MNFMNDCKCFRVSSNFNLQDLKSEATDLFFLYLPGFGGFIVQWLIVKGNFWNSKNLMYLKELNIFQIIYKTFGYINTTLQI